MATPKAVEEKAFKVLGDAALPMTDERARG